MDDKESSASESFFSFVWRFHLSPAARPSDQGGQCKPWKSHFLGHVETQNCQKPSKTGKEQGRHRTTFSSLDVTGGALPGWWSWYGSSLWRVPELEISPEHSQRHGETIGISEFWGYHGTLDFVAAKAFLSICFLICRTPYLGSFHSLVDWLRHLHRGTFEFHFVWRLEPSRARTRGTSTFGV